MEAWEKIVGYDNYLISSCGTVKNIKTSRILKQQDNGKGYKLVDLCKDGKATKKYIHRLVALAFICNPNGYKEVNHIDENKSNNHVSNLEWCTHAYNMRYGNCIRNIGKSKNRFKKPIIQLTKDGRYLKTYSGINEASRVTGVHIWSISESINKGWLGGGYRWIRKAGD